MLHGYCTWRCMDNMHTCTCMVVQTVYVHERNWRTIILLELKLFNLIHPIAPIWAQRIHVPISLWDLYGGFNTRRYTLVHGFCFSKLFPIGCIGLSHSAYCGPPVQWSLMIPFIFSCRISLSKPAECSHAARTLVTCTRNRHYDFISRWCWVPFLALVPCVNALTLWILSILINFWDRYSCISVNIRMSIKANALTYTQTTIR